MPKRINVVWSSKARPNNVQVFAYIVPEDELDLNDTDLISNALLEGGFGVPNDYNIYSVSIHELGGLTEHDY